LLKLIYPIFFARSMGKDMADRALQS